MAQIINNPNGGINGGTVDGGGARPLDTYDLGLNEAKPYTKIPFDITKINIKDIIGDTSSTKVLCKDGTFGYDTSSSNAKYDNSKTCINNGGRAENQQVLNETVNLELIKQDAEDKFYEKLGIKTQVGGFMSGKIASKSKGRVLVLLVLVAGYFAYKKFKK